jgi:hypothetical protein
MFSVRLHLIVLKLAVLIGFAGLTQTGFAQQPSSSINGSDSPNYKDQFATAGIR